MQANYHTHTWRCHHAVGTEREYIEEAIRGGYQTLGFSDHSPYVFDGDYYSGFRVTHEDLPGYFETLLKLREEYKNEIRILIGFEAEYYPRYFRRMQKLLAEYPLDYLIMGQHFTGNETDDIAWWCQTATKDPTILKQYVDQTCEGLKTGCFTYMAHPDVLIFTGDETLYEEEAHRLCLCAKEENIPLEVNFLGLWDHRSYPSERFFRIAGEVGNTIVFGCDAHSPDRVYQPETYKKAMEFIGKFGLKHIEDIVLRNPFNGMN